MLNTPSLILHSDLNDRLNSIGLTWEWLLREATAIIQFGSSVCSPDDYNDIDLLCIGNGVTRLTKKIDLIWLPESMLGETRWLTSELAGHIAQYGICIKGDVEWRSSVNTGDSAVSRKYETIQQHISSASKIWDRFGNAHKRRQLRLIRRQVQRLQLLKLNIPVPHNSALDRLWQRVDLEAKQYCLQDAGLRPELLEFLNSGANLQLLEQA